MIHVIGYDSDVNCVVLLHNNNEKLRGFDDFRKLNRTSKRNESSWKPHLTRSVTSVEKWINGLLAVHVEVVSSFLDDDLHAAEKEALRVRKLAEARPRMLQQYFASDLNIHTVLQLAYESLVDVDSVCFVEPSCGDGRILQSLLQRGANNVVGCDIDPVVAQQADQAVRAAMRPHQRAAVVVQDFLTTTRETFLSTAAPTTSGEHTDESSVERVVVIGGPPYSIVPPPPPTPAPTQTPTQTSQCQPPTSSSGAPVTHTMGEDSPASTAGTSSERPVAAAASSSSGGEYDYSTCSREDYPLLFLAHCAVALRAERIVFILPDRCAQEGFIQKATRAMNGECASDETTGADHHPTTKRIRLNDSSCSSGGGRDADSGGEWRLTSCVAGDNSFDLLGKVIKQPTAGDLFGYAVCISSDGQTIAASSPGKSLGYVYVLALSSFGAGHSWSIVGEVGVTTSTTESGFGTTLSMDASGTAFVMASYTSYGNMGYLEVYQYSSTYQNWAQTGVANDSFGSSVAASLSASVCHIAVGAPSVAKVYLYAFDMTSYSVQLDRVLSSRQGDSQFGYSLSLTSGAHLVVGSPLNSLEATSAGAFDLYLRYVYPTSVPTSTPTMFAIGDNSGGGGVQWNLLGSALSGSATDDKCGMGLALDDSGYVVAMGCSGSANVGSVSVYQFDSSQWQLVNAAIDGTDTGGEFGFSVALNGDGTMLIVGSPHGSSQADLGQGTAHVYVQKNNAWTAYVPTIEGTADSYFGVSVAMSTTGSTVAVAAPLAFWGTYTYNGVVVAYGLTEGYSASILGLTLGLPANSLQWGATCCRHMINMVAMSRTGDVIAVSGVLYDRTTSDVGLLAVYEYDAMENDWSVRGQAFIGTTQNEALGEAVALNEDGTVLAFGVGEYAGIGPGHVKIHRYGGSSMRWEQWGSSIVGPHTGALFGSSLALNARGDVVAIAAIYYSANGHNGLVQVYGMDRSVGSWTQIGGDFVGTTGDAWYSVRVAINAEGNIVAVSEPLNDEANADAGKVYVYQSALVAIRTPLWGNTTELARSASCRDVVRPDWSQLSCKWLPDRQIALLSSYVPNAVTAVEVLVQGRPVVVSVASQLRYEGGVPLVADVCDGSTSTCVSVLRYATAPALPSSLFDFGHRLFLANATARVALPLSGVFPPMAAFSRLCNVFGQCVEVPREASAARPACHLQLRCRGVAAAEYHVFAGDATVVHGALTWLGAPPPLSSSVTWQWTVTDLGDNANATATVDRLPSGHAATVAIAADTFAAFGRYAVAASVFYANGSLAASAAATFVSDPKPLTATLDARDGNGNGHVTVRGGSPTDFNATLRDDNAYRPTAADDDGEDDAAVVSVGYQCATDFTFATLVACPANVTLTLQPLGVSQQWAEESATLRWATLRLRLAAPAALVGQRLPLQLTVHCRRGGRSLPAATLSLTVTVVAGDSDVAAVPVLRVPPSSWPSSGQFASVAQLAAAMASWTATVSTASACSWALAYPT
eukprot:gene9630-6891_t